MVHDLHALKRADQRFVVRDIALHLFADKAVEHVAVAPHEDAGLFVGVVLELFEDGVTDVAGRARKAYAFWHGILLYLKCKMQNTKYKIFVRGEG